MGRYTSKQLETAAAKVDDAIGREVAHQQASGQYINPHIVGNIKGVCRQLISLLNYEDIQTKDAYLASFDPGHHKISRALFAQILFAGLGAGCTALGLRIPDSPSAAKPPDFKP